MKKLLPTILAILTRTDREQITFNWSTSWVYNLFRIWEVIFWRRIGIRCEGIFDGERVYSFTLEHFLSSLESYIRSSHIVLPRLVRVPVVQLAGLSSQYGRLPYSFAIAVDTVGTTALDPTSPFTLAYTVTGSNPAITTSWTQGAGSTQSVTYAGAALTDVGYASVSPDPRNIGLSYKVGCATGNNNLVYTFSAGTPRLAVASYSGVGGTDGTTTNSGTGTSLTTSITTTLANDWLISASAESTSPVAGGTGTTLREASASNGSFALVDSNGALAAGSNSLQITGSGSQGMGMSMLAFSPSGAVATTTHLKMLLGVGI